MYARPYEPKKMKLPENYRGNAFGASGEYTDMPPPARISHQVYDLPPEEIVRAETNVTDTPLVTKNHPLPTPIADEPTDIKAALPEVRESHQKANTPAVKDPTAQAGSIFSMLMPPSSSASKFPFGHGIGAEELLILGMMLLVFSQADDREGYDNELIFLLALLLFSG